MMVEHGADHLPGSRRLNARNQRSLRWPSELEFETFVTIDLDLALHRLRTLERFGRKS